MRSKRGLNILLNTATDRKMLYTILSVVMIAVLTLTVVYAALSTTLNINGNAEVSAASWDVYLDNIQLNSESATSNVPTITDKTTATFSTTLSEPGDFYEFTIDVVNNGTIDAMINSVEKTPTLTEAQAKYLKYVVEYENGEVISTKQLVSKHSFVRLKVKVEFRSDISASDIPQSAETLSLSFKVNYVQSDEGGTSVSNNGIIGNVLENKSAIFFGDSVAYGYSTSGNGFGYYINKVASFSSYTNAAVNTATLNTETQGTNNVIEQMKKNKNGSYDYVVIEGGYGDLRDTPSLGSITSGYIVSEFDTTTFAGAVEYTLYLATTYWEDARIGFIISYDTPNSNYGVRPDHEATKEYWDIVKVACDKWNVDYLDFFEGSTTYNGETKTYSELFDVTGNTYLADDNIHPTATGYEFIAPFIAEWMKTLSVYERDFEIVTDDTSSITPDTLTIVYSFSDLIFVRDKTIPGLGAAILVPTWNEDAVVGRASAVNYLVEVNGGETIGLSSSASGVTYAIGEFDSNKTVVNVNQVDGNGETHRAWLSEDVTLTSSTRYIVVSFKNGDGTTSFTDEQLTLLPTYIEFK